MSNSMQTIQHLDNEALEELKEVMEDEFNVLLLTYISDSIARIEAIRETLESRNFDELTKMAHSFKGSCGNIGAPYLAELCRQLEIASRDEIFDDLPLIVDKIVQEFEEVKQLISQLSL